MMYWYRVGYIYGLYVWKWRFSYYWDIDFERNTHFWINNFDAEEETTILGWLTFWSCSDIFFINYGTIEFGILSLLFYKGLF